LVVRLWPAVAIVLPWLLVRWHLRLASDLAQTGAFERLMNRLADPGPLLAVLRDVPVGRGMLWIGLAVAFAVGARRLVREERFLALAILIQLAFYIGAYLVTPHDIVWHVKSSWERLVRQVLPAIVLLALLITERESASRLRRCHTLPRPSRGTSGKQRIIGDT
ncbi:MAG TPA: hypothetical protein VHK90_05575, partial [Thermoanaerobaculia bacterium]|nr:hypothetical protein [Thermoanaerobaculia bacterium]